jgi:hypothetical protein
MQIVKQAAIIDLCPTQVTAGMREVALKRLRWREKGADAAAQYLSGHCVPVVVGPGSRLYMIDRHHLTIALYEEGVEEVSVSVVGNASELSPEGFWAALESLNLTHPFDDEGRRCSFEDMPNSIVEVKDDLYRSLAGALKRAGGYAKNKTPFSEFRWADFLRSRVDRAVVEHDFDRALGIAVSLAQSVEAEGLPGWQPSPELIRLHSSMAISSRNN